MLTIVKKMFIACCLAMSMAVFSVLAVAQETPININTADAQQMATMLAGVGKVKAQAIVALRESLGGYTDILQLLQVKGIGPKTLELNQDIIALE